MEKEEKEELKEFIKNQIEIATITHVNEEHNKKNSFDLSGGYKVLLIIACCLGVISTLIAIISRLYP